MVVFAYKLVELYNGTGININKQQRQLEVTMKL